MRRCTTHHYGCACREAKFAELESENILWALTLKAETKRTQELERDNAEIKLRCESLRQSYQKEIDALKCENAQLKAASDKSDSRTGKRPTYRTLEDENAALRKSIERHGQANDKLVMEIQMLRRKIDAARKEKP